MSRYHYGPWRDRYSRRMYNYDNNPGRGSNGHYHHVRTHSNDLSEGSSRVPSIPQMNVRPAFPRSIPSPYAPASGKRDVRIATSKIVGHRRTPVRDDSRDDLQSQLLELSGPAYVDRTRCDDAIDPISQQRIWDTHEDRGSQRYADFSEIRYLFSYYEVSESGRHFVRGFAVETMQQLLLQGRKRAGPILHPASGVAIPEEAIQRAEQLIEVLVKAGKMERECDADPASWTLQDIKNDPHQMERLRKMTFSVFQPFYTRASLELADDVLTKLSLKDLKVLAKEMKGMFVRNFEPSQRRELLAHSSTAAFVDPPYWENDVVPWIHYLLSNIHLTTSGPTVSSYLIKFTMYVFVAAIGVVSPSVRERYSESFALDFELPPDGNARRVE